MPTYALRGRAFASPSVLLALSITLAACGAADVGPGGPGSLTLDAQLSSPQPNATGVGVSAPLSIVVKEKLETSTVTDQNVHLMPGTSHDMSGDDATDTTDEDTSNDPVPGTVSYNETTGTITFAPKVALEQGRMYHLHISNVMLKGNKPLKTGVDTIQYNFTTLHAHEYKRLDYDENNPLVVERDRRTTVVNNMRTKRTQYNGPKSSGNIDYIRYYDTSLPATGEQVDYYQTDAQSNVTRYQRKLLQGGKEYRVTYLGSGNVRNYWTPGTAHGSHMTEYHYQATDRNTGALWPTTPDNDPNFPLMHASVMEMNHGEPVSDYSANNFQHRHIFYSDLGLNGLIDFDSVGPNPVDDIVSVYHTRDLVNGVRQYSWSWYGNDTSRQDGKGSDLMLFTGDDLAYRVQVYIYNNKNQRKRRVTYEVPRNTPGKTRQEWEQLIQQDGYSSMNTLYTPQPTSQYLHSYRDYEYDFNTGARTKVIEYHKENGLLVKTEERFYSTEPNIDGDLQF